MSLEPDDASARKARGAFFTPAPVAEYITAWAVRSADDRVLEPSCGEAAFLRPAAARLRALGAGSDLRASLVGAELHESSARAAEREVRREGVEGTIHVGDFLLRDPEATFDAVIGNPPYVRYQDFAGPARAAAQKASLRAGVRLTNLASSWAAFTVHSAMHVRRGGRLGLVLPAEILSVNYAAPVRDFLMREFGRVRLVLFTERVFPGVQEDVVLLLAEDRGAPATDHCELLHARNSADLAALTEADVRRWVPVAGTRWSTALVDPVASAAYADAIASDAFVDLQVWGDTTLGMVTGKNAFFALTPAEVAARALSDDDVIPLSPPGSRHLRSIDFTEGDWQLLGEGMSRTHLFRPAGPPSAAALAYIREGEARGVHEGYKCRVRSPWWRVPYLPPADLLLTYMNADTARLCSNRVRAHHLNSVHGVYLKQEHAELGRNLLALASLNSMTLLGAEIVGRSYGGGVLKMEPREADVWPMPSPDLVRTRSRALRAVTEPVRMLLADGQLVSAVAKVDEVLFPGVLDEERRDALRSGRQALHERRVSRASGR